MERDDNILRSIKRLLGPSEDYEHFDPDIMFHINAALSVLRQLGVGPTEGFRLEDGTERWTEFLGEGVNYELVKEYVYMKVKLAFDPPSSGTMFNAMQEALKEFEWRSFAEPEIEKI